MILSNRAILEALKIGDIRIDPFTTKNLNPASYDVTLGDEVRVYDDWVISNNRRFFDREPMVDGGDLGIHQKTRIYDPSAPYDDPFRYNDQGSPTPVYARIDEPMTTTSYVIDPKIGWLLQPGIGYLMHTRERIYARNYVPIIDGKSSLGRLFIQIHVTAGYGDAGFDGQYTLEVVVTHPIRVFAGMRFGQMRFHVMEGEPLHSYEEKGNYVGEHAVGAVASMAWKQFAKRSP